MTAITRSFYDTIDASTAQMAQSAAVDIKQSMQRTLKEIIFIGGKLVEVQNTLKSKGFQEWLHEEFTWSKSQAYNFINAYERFGNHPNLEQLDIAVSAINLLAAPNTPNDVVDDMIQRAEQGEKITHKKAKHELDQHKKKRDKVVNPLPGMEAAGVTPKPATEFSSLPPSLPSTPTQAPKPEPTEGELCFARRILLEVAYEYAENEWQEHYATTNIVEYDKEALKETAQKLLETKTVESLAQQLHNSRKVLKEQL
jgi:hypothetical protein